MSAAGEGSIGVSLLGSTGSIGTQALDIIGRHPQRFHVSALAAGRNAELVIAQARQFGVRCVAMADAEAARIVRQALGDAVQVLDGLNGVTELAGQPTDVVLNGIDGSRGLGPTLAALQAGSRVALANKESLVLGGELVTAALQRPDQLVPVDSEHSALAQCLRGGEGREVARLVLTASGGPFRDHTREQLGSVTVADALAHPTWDMGDLVTINSATMANKGLEVIEAHVLFGLPYDRIDVVVHPQSVVHGMVEFVDGATVAKLSPPDMRLPIQLALGWPHRLAYAPTRMDWTVAHALTFQPVDHERFPLLGLLVAAGQQGGTAAGVANAANEEAVTEFLAGRLGFLDIAEVVSDVLNAHESGSARDLAEVLAAEDWARLTARDLIGKRN